MKKNVTKKVLALIGAAALSVGLLAGCGSTGSDENGAASGTSAASGAAGTETAKTETNASAAGAASEDNVIKVAASAVPHAEILEAAKPILAEQGYELEIQIFDDYVQPNEVVEAGDFDANYFQHIPYLESFNEEKGTHLVNAGGIHYEPFGLYPGKETDLANIDGATIAVPNDTTNEARALLLLQDNGYIKLADGVGLTATVTDIIENPHNIEIIELEAAQIPRTLPDVSFGILNGNYAMEAGLTVADDALLYESAESEAAATYVNVIAVKELQRRSNPLSVICKKEDESSSCTARNSYHDRNGE